MSSEKSILYVVASIVIIIAGMKASSEVLVPFILSIFITLLLVPILNYLTRHGVSRSMAFSMLTITTLISLILTTGVLSSYLADLASNSAYLQIKFTQSIQKGLDFINSYGFNIQYEFISKFLHSEDIFNFLIDIIKSVSTLLSDSITIFFIVIFMLLESFYFEQKLSLIIKDDKKFVHELKLFIKKIKEYFTIKAKTSLLTGVLITLALYILDVKYFILWGVRGFFLNFVPVIGSIIAAIPPILITLAEQSFGDVLIVALIFIAINTIVGNIIEPKIMGKGLGLSEIVVFISLLFWGWIFGKIGMFLAVPLTIIVKFALEIKESTRWIAILLSDGSVIQKK